MASVVVLAAYALCGGIGAVLLLRVGKVGPVSGASGAIAMILLWPFLLPGLFSEEGRAGRARTARTQRLDELAQALEDAWLESDPTASREREVTRGFIERLRRRDVNLGELEASIAKAAASVRPRLERLYEDAGRELDQGAALLEEMIAQLTLLRFSGLAHADGADGERAKVEDLLARIEALANLGGLGG